MGSPVRVGSICSGMMTEHWALELLPWRFEEVFWCEKGVAPRQFIEANIDPRVAGFSDVMSDEFLNGAPPCDILLAGFPCQPFSVAGANHGLQDKEGRGVVVIGILRYVKQNKPHIVVLENVKGLAGKHRGVLDNVVASLERLGYVVSWKVLDMDVHGGVPCRRSRVYIVAILSSMPATGGSSRPATGGSLQPAAGVSSGPATGGSSGPAVMVWPGPIPCADISTIFDDTVKLTDFCDYPFHVTGQTKNRNLRRAVEKVKEQGIRESRDPTTYNVVADLGGTNLNVGWGVCPCITKSRGAALAYWSISHGRPLTVNELCRLQGLNPDWLNITVSPHQMGALLGNGYACTVIARVIAAAIQAVECSATGGMPATGGRPAPDNTPATGCKPATGGMPAGGGNPPARGGNPADGRSRQRDRSHRRTGWRQTADPARGRRPVTGGANPLLKRSAATSSDSNSLLPRRSARLR